jgi:hypothetical protein
MRNRRSYSTFMVSDISLLFDYINITFPASGMLLLRLLSMEYYVRIITMLKHTPRFTSNIKSWPYVMRTALRSCTHFIQVSQ